MLVLDAAAVACALPFDRLIAALRERFAAGCQVPPRHVHEIHGSSDATRPAPTSSRCAASSRASHAAASADVAAVRRAVSSLPSSSASGTPLDASCSR